MMGHRERLICAAEHDALPRRAHTLFDWQPGARAKLKRKFWKRVRKKMRLCAEAEGFSPAPGAS